MLHSYSASQQVMVRRHLAPSTSTMQNRQHPPSAPTAINIRIHHASVPQSTIIRRIYPPPFHFQERSLTQIYPHPPHLPPPYNPIRHLHPSPIIPSSDAIRPLHPSYITPTQSDSSNSALGIHHLYQHRHTGSSIQTGKKYDDTIALWGFMETHTWS